MSKVTLSQIRHVNSEQFSLQIDHLVVEEGEIVCLLGPSGCGKSTTLRLAAGLERPSSGEVQIGNQIVASKTKFIGAEERRVGLVFQDYALFPHLNVSENVAFGLDHLPKQERREIARSLLEQMGLARYMDHYPHMLSGGEQQRVALARALAPNPRLLLMDEPFSGLDTVLRDQVRDETFRLLKKTGTTVLLVTHDPEEAMRMADRIVLMKDGNIVQSGSPAELYSHPADAFVASFLGQVNVINATAVDGILQTELGQVAHPKAIASQGACQVLVRPEAIRMEPVRDEGEVVADVLFVRNLGPYVLVDLQLSSGTIATARAASLLQPEPGERVSIQLDRRQVFFFPA